MIEALLNGLWRVIQATAALFGITPGLAAVVLGFTLAVVVMVLGIACIALSTTPILESDRAPVPPRRKGEPRWVL